MSAGKVCAVNHYLGYYYVTADHAAKIDEFRRTSGDMEKVLIAQYVRGWLGKNRDFCLDLGRSDAFARGMQFSDWAEFVYQKSIQELPPPKHEVKLPPSPLANINLPAKEQLVRRKVNNLTLGVQNVVLFKLIDYYYYGDRRIDLVSDIVAEHLNRLWEPLYASQVAANDFSNWI